MYFSDWLSDGDWALYSSVPWSVTVLAILSLQSLICFTWAML
jgi:hypothetical protein